MTILDAEALAKQLQVSTATVKRLALQGRIPSLRLGHRTLRFDLDEVLEAIRESTAEELKGRLVGENYRFARTTIRSCLRRAIVQKDLVTPTCPVEPVPRLALSSRELADSLGVSERTITTWHAEGAGRTSIKLGRLRLYAVDQVRQWLNQRAHGQTDD